MQNQKIEFKKERDFSTVFGDSLKFIKQNFKSFFSCILLIAGPFILLMSIGVGYMQANMMKFAVTANMGSVFNSGYFISIGVTVLFGLLSSIVLSGTVYHYLNLYHEKPFGEKITTSEVSQRVLSNIGTLLGAMFALLVYIVLAGIVIGLVAVGLGSMFNEVGIVLVVLSLIVLMIIYLPVVSYFVPASFYVIVRDNVGINSAMKNVRQYLSGNFWWTWLIMVVAIISIGILKTVFGLPANIINMMSVFSRIKNPTEISNGDTNMLFLILTTIGTFLTQITSSIQHVIAAFNYMGHEEKHEGQGMLSRIDEIK